jgi:hypothetical protein
MVLEACYCSEGAGLPHNHLYDFGPWVAEGKGRYRRAMGEERGVWYGRQINDQIRLWVNWKDVARALLASTIVTSSAPGNDTQSSTPHSPAGNLDA